MKAIRDVYSFIQGESLKINQSILPHTVITECICAALKFSENTVRKIFTEFKTCNLPGKKLFSFQQVLLQYNNYTSKETILQMQTLVINFISEF
jgi:hypothetical protein